jgi:serine/threonine-protein kinase RsbW
LDVLHQSTLAVQTRLTQLDHVLIWFRSSHSPEIDPKTWIQCELALAEGFTNAVRHAHGGLAATTPIELEVLRYSDRLEIRIWDHGPPFDLEACLSQANAAAGNRNGGGGRGIAILHKIADHLSYCRTEHQQNCLLIVKSYCPSILHEEV